MKPRKPSHDDRGVTSIEYGLLAVAIAVAVVVVAFTLGGAVVKLFAGLNFPS